MGILTLILPNWEKPDVQVATKFAEGGQKRPLRRSRRIPCVDVTGNGNIDDQKARCVFCAGELSYGGPVVLEGSNRVNSTQKNHAAGISDSRTPGVDEERVLSG